MANEQSAGMVCRLKVGKLEWKSSMVVLVMVVILVVVVIEGQQEIG